MSTDERMTSRSILMAKYRIVLLVLIDLCCLVVSCLVFLNRSPDIYYLEKYIRVNMYIILALVFVFRFLFGLYNQMWRYANAMVFLRVVLSDLCAGLVYLVIDRTMMEINIPVANAVAAIGTGLLATLSSRFIYQAMRRVPWKRSKNKAISSTQPANKIGVAIVGAGELGSILAEELRLKPNGQYQPVCFFDNNPRKIGSTVSGIPVYGPDDKAKEIIETFPIQEIIIALPNMDSKVQRQVFDSYKKTGCKIKLYDYPLDVPEGESGKRTIREINIEDLLQRKAVHLDVKETRQYYADKTVLITGGGGSIGSELARQIARAKPRKLVLLDVYENGVYDIQQELKELFGSAIDLQVVICSICDQNAMRDMFQTYHPQVIFHAAAHKHVPLMENNCREAVRNNVFGTLNVINLAEEYGVERFVMISTDKAVNPTNIMGATKRLCEIIIQSRNNSKTDFVAVRFGNVLGSNGSVVPLFKRQIAAGGPVTLTDKRIIRYFMTIPEAVQLVLRTGIRGEKAEIYVLDMGNPVKILDMAESLISLSGYQPYKDIDIVEVGLRPGEKLYEELLIDRDTVIKTQDERIYIDHDQLFTRDQVEHILSQLKASLDAADDNASVRAAMMQAVNTYRHPEDVNSCAADSKEMKTAFIRTNAN